MHRSSEHALLSEAGLFGDIAAGVVAADARPFAPSYWLWADASSKRRWLYLPPATTIDTTDLDGWVFPLGTKVWKEFALAGKPLATRLLEKRASGWHPMAF